MSTFPKLMGLLSSLGAGTFFSSILERVTPAGTHQSVHPSMASLCCIQMNMIRGCSHMPSKGHNLDSTLHHDVQPLHSRDQHATTKSDISSCLQHRSRNTALQCHEGISLILTAEVTVEDEACTKSSPLSHPPPPPCLWQHPTPV